jgi:hypothetical protein
MSQLVVFTSPLALYHVLSHLRSYLFIYRFIFEALSSWSIAVLELAARLAEYSLWSRMAYLTDFLGLDTSHAAAILNACKGVETLMPIGMAFLVDSFVGEYCMLLFSSLSYSLVSFQIFPHSFAPCKVLTNKKEIMVCQIWTSSKRDGSCNSSLLESLRLIQIC